MVNGNDLLEFMEENIEQLTNDFLNHYCKEWNDWVLEEYNNKGVD